MQRAQQFRHHGFAAQAEGAQLPDIRGGRSLLHDGRPSNGVANGSAAEAS
jgi:hypothetical protein